MKIYIYFQHYDFSKLRCPKPKTVVKQPKLSPKYLLKSTVQNFQSCLTANENAYQTQIDVQGEQLELTRRQETRAGRESEAPPHHGERFERRYVPRRPNGSLASSPYHVHAHGAAHGAAQASRSPSATGDHHPRRRQRSLTAPSPHSMLSQPSTVRPNYNGHHYQGNSAQVFLQNNTQPTTTSSRNEVSVQTTQNIFNSASSFPEGQSYYTGHQIHTGTCARSRTSYSQTSQLYGRGSGFWPSSRVF